MSSFHKKLKREKVFHERWASTIDLAKIDVDAAFEGSTSPENRFILSNLGDLSGKYILDLGCGAGESSVYFARKRARCVACDYSTSMVEKAKLLAEQYGVNIKNRVVNAMELDFNNNTFDIVYASNILHHVDAKKCLHEIHRVLKPGGKACTWDPLRHNPLINIYRRIARQVRTKDEQALSIFFVNEFKTLFSRVKYDTFWIATLWIFLRFFLIERVNPNKERYWKKIIYEEVRLRRTYYRLEKLDYYLKKFPLMKCLSWNLAVVAEK